MADHITPEGWRRAMDAGRRFGQAALHDLDDVAEEFGVDLQSTLTDFLLARIAEDEVAARGAKGRVEAGGPAALLISRFDPARVLAECEAKRLTVRFLSDLERGNYEAAMAGSVAYSVLCRMATVHADHPDYLPEWRP